LGLFVGSRRHHRDKDHGRHRTTAERVPTAPNGSVWFPVLLILAGATAYVDSFDGAFVFDNQPHIVENQQIRTLFPLWHLLANRRPVVEVSLAINYALGALEPFGYHLFNIVVHVLAGLTLFGLLRRTLCLERFSPRVRQSAPLLAFAAALLWLVHPLQTQSVTYVIQRGESMMGLFYLLTMYAMLRGARGRWWWYVLSVAACALGMGTKAVMVTAPVMALAFDALLIADGWRDALRRRWGLYLALCSTWGVLFAVGVVQGVLSTDRPSGMVGFSHPDVTSWHYMCTQPAVLLRYVRLAFVPVGQSLDYGWPIAKHVGGAMMPGLLVVLVLGGTLYALVRRHPLGVVGAWFFVILAPTSSFIPIQDPIYEHRMYLSLASITVLVVFALFALVSRSADVSGDERKGRVVFLTAVFVLACSLGTTTALRNRIYGSPLRMWRDVVTKNPNGARARYNLGWALQQLGRDQEAFAEYAKAVELNPSFSLPYNNLGMAKLASGNLAEAESYLRRAVRLDPDFADAWGNLGMVLARRGDLTGAKDALRRAIAIDPTLAQPHFNLGLVFARTQAYTEAEQAFRQAIACDPRLPSAHYNLGHALAEQGRFAAAAGAFEQELRVNPSHANARQMLEAARRRAREP